MAGFVYHGKRLDGTSKMAIDLRRDNGIPIREVPNWLPKRNGKKVHFSTVFRWVTKGARGRVLESVLIGGIRYTTIEAIERFLGTTPTPPEIPAAAQEASISDIEEVLRADGL